MLFFRIPVFRETTEESETFSSKRYQPPRQAAALKTENYPPSYFSLKNFKHAH